MYEFSIHIALVYTFLVLNKDREINSSIAVFLRQIEGNMEIN